MRPAMRMCRRSTTPALWMLWRFRQVPKPGVRWQSPWTSLRTMQKGDVPVETRAPTATSARVRPAHTKNSSQASLCVSTLPLKRPRRRSRGSRGLATIGQPGTPEVQAAPMAPPHPRNTLAVAAPRPFFKGRVSPRACSELVRPLAASMQKKRPCRNFCGMCIRKDRPKKADLLAAKRRRPGIAGGGACV